MTTGNSQPPPMRPSLLFPPRDIPSSSQPDTAPSPPSKRDLASWWKQFKRNGRKEDDKGQERGIFGVPLNVSIKYANVAISLTNDNGESFIYGYVPIVVAKCGVFLKEKATDVEGIFRLSGSARRIKDLQEVFNSPERYGKGLNWEGYTVHDAANVLRRYLNQLPEPIVPLNFYERFRDPLRHHQAQAVRAMRTGNFDYQAAVTTYQQLIRELPPLNRQLLLYILDLLAVFASKSDQNRMTSTNLAAIFQPGLLSHPAHDMAPEEYRLSQDVLIFLIENQDHFLFGMNGTAADAQTVRELESRSAAAPLSSHSNLRRSASNASGGADSLRKYEALRRNVSVSSKQSRTSGHAPSPSTPTSLAGVGIHRSNTVPSKKSPALPSSRASRAPEPAVTASAGLTRPGPPTRMSRSGSRTPPLRSPQLRSSTGALAGSATVKMARPSTEVTATVADCPSSVQAAALGAQPVGVSPSSNITTPPRKISSFFSKSPPAPGELKEIRQPNRLRKKKIPGSANESAQSSSNSLHATSNDPLNVVSFQTANGGLHASSDMAVPGETALNPVRETPGLFPHHREGSHHHHRTSESTLRPNGSRTPSVQSRSSFTDHSDPDPPDEASKTAKKENRRSWRFPLSPKWNNESLPIPHMGSNAGSELSSSSFGSSNRQRRSSANGSSHLGTDTFHPLPTQDPDFISNLSYLKEPSPAAEPEKRSLLGKFKAKVAHMKDGVRDSEAERDLAKNPQQPDTEKLHVSQENESRNGTPVSPEPVKENVNTGFNTPHIPHSPTSAAPLSIPEEPALTVNIACSDPASSDSAT